MRILILMASIYGLTGVILGAFGAHALKSRLAPEALVSFETGVRYQLIHAVLLILLAILAQTHAATLLRVSGACVAAGIFLFSGSIYLLATRELTGLTSWRWLGPVTPVGGLLMITGWILLLVWALRAGPVK